MIPFEALAAVDDGDLDTVLKRVDRAINRAKANSRNRCELADPAAGLGTEPG